LIANAECKASIFFLSLFFFNTSIALELEIKETLIKEVEQTYGPFAGKRLLAWKKILATSPKLPDLEKLEIVNRFFNQIIFVSDLVHWGQTDYWATPVEFLASNGGDCEDFSIAKYFTLLALNIPDKKMQLTYVKALSINEAHMVLTYFTTPQAIPLVLDNLRGDIVSADLRADLIPVYSFNGTGLWEAKERGLGRRLGDSSSLRRWKKVTMKMLKTFKKGAR